MARPTKSKRKAALARVLTAKTAALLTSFAGAAVIVAGVAMWSGQIAVIVAGSFVLLFGLFFDFEDSE